MEIDSEFDERKWYSQFSLILVKWSSTSKIVCIEASQLQEWKWKVWCGLWYLIKPRGQIVIGPPSPTYRHMLGEFFLPKVNDIDGDDTFSQQDSVIYHTAAVTLDLLLEKFGALIISRNRLENWPRSYDFMPVEYFLPRCVQSPKYMLIYQQQCKILNTTCEQL